MATDVVGREASGKEDFVKVADRVSRGSKFW
jgi:hypothetical protein